MICGAIRRIPPNGCGVHPLSLSDRYVRKRTQKLEQSIAFEQLDSFNSNFKGFAPDSHYDSTPGLCRWLYPLPHKNPRTITCIRARRGASYIEIPATTTANKGTAGARYIEQRESMLTGQHINAPNTELCLRPTAMTKQATITCVHGSAMHC
jgi:hypothetical protein